MIAGHPHGHGQPRKGIADFDFHQSPFVVIWETTRACDLACKHCRAEAVPHRNPLELSTDEAKRMLDRVREFGPVVFVLSGGDFLKRPDAFELIEYGFRLGLRMAVTPATTPLCTPETIDRLKASGISRLAISLDGSCPEIHDEFRRVPGSFEWGMKILEHCRTIGLSTQVNTVFAKHNIGDFDNLAALMAKMGIVFWEVFFLVPMGRAKPDDVASAENFELLFNKMYDLSKVAPFDLKATAAPQYSRVLLQRQVEERRAGEREEAPDVLTGGLMFSTKDGIGRARSVNDGDGFMFISHTGEIMPSGFLPIPAGNVRTDDLVEVYRTSPVFSQLRDRSALKGKCGVCEYQKVCGGSRARAYAMTGDFLEAEPFCAYVPPRYAKMVEAGEAEPVEEYFARRTRSALPLAGAGIDG
ncbi:MAG TPA: TIGR04053 family radical SAM/SPASM domain-containing protein [Gemmatimonadaceae bacterium]